VEYALAIEVFLQLSLPLQYAGVALLRMPPLKIMLNLIPMSSLAVEILVYMHRSDKFSFQAFLAIPLFTSGWK
jgi:hypothetical protein